MKRSDYREVQVHASGPVLELAMRVGNSSRRTWAPESFSLGWQFFDPETNLFILEGAWQPVSAEVKPGEAASFAVSIPFPPETGAYEVFVSPLQSGEWTYARGEPFVRLRVESAEGQVRVLHQEIATLRALGWRQRWAALPRLLANPVRTIARNHRLIRSMARRDILARYRGSFGDIFWTVLNPLLLMVTYFFVFGVVLQTRFGPDQSRTGFALYFLAGMLPWLAFSEPVGRAPYVIAEHRNFVKKLIFPLDTLPVNQVLSGLVTEMFGTLIFVAALVVLRGALPASVLWLPVLLIPQLMFTLGVCWFLAALGAFVRDLGQIMTFVLTLWFFITPICYPETSLATLPRGALAILGKNPLFTLVRGYRAIFLEGHAPEITPLLKLWAVGVIFFLLGHIWFHKLRRSFADVI